MALTVGSLFSGIGGFDLGFERAGFQIAWQCEIDPWARKVLKKHWPSVECYEDIRTIGAHNLPPVDVLIGGFPCQDISIAGKGAGIDGARSGLWSEYARLIDELRPRYAVMENVAALLHRGLGRVLGDLAEVGYNAEWQMLPASAFGAPHRRDRIFIVAYPQHAGPYRRGADEHQRERQEVWWGEQPGRDGGNGAMAYPTGAGFPYWGGTPLGQPEQKSELERRSCESIGVSHGGNSNSITGQQAHTQALTEQGKRHTWVGLTGLDWGDPPRTNWWAVEPPVGRVANGIPRRVDRLRGLGNAIVPQVAQYVAECVMAHAQSMEAVA